MSLRVSMIGKPRRLQDFGTPVASISMRTGRSISFTSWAAFSMRLVSTTICLQCWKNGHHPAQDTLARTRSVSYVLFQRIRIDALVNGKISEDLSGSTIKDLDRFVLDSRSIYYTNLTGTGRFFPSYFENETETDTS